MVYTHIRIRGFEIFLLIWSNHLTIYNNPTIRWILNKKINKTVIELTEFQISEKGFLKLASLNENDWKQWFKQSDSNYFLEEVDT